MFRGWLLKLKIAIWDNIWFWRYQTVIMWIVLSYIVYWVFTDILPDYELMYETLETLGYLP